MCKTCEPLKQMDDKELSKAISGWLVVMAAIVLILGIICVLSSRSEGEAAPIKNSLGVVIETTNPYAYLMGQPIRGSVMYDSKTDKWATNIVIQPAWTPLLFEQTVLLCGDQVDTLGPLRGVIVLTYRRKEHELFKGIACHDLISASEVPTKKKGEK